MDLGSLASYPMPANIRSAFGADTAQQLADGLGIDVTPTPELAQRADAAYNEYRKGNLDGVRAFMKSDLGMSDEKIDEALTKLSKA
jgi:hypothetical protein